MKTRLGLIQVRDADKNVDFIDALTAAWIVKNELAKIYTFDQKHFNRFEGIAVELPQ